MVMAIKSVLQGIVDQVASNRQQERDAKLYTNLMRHEARLGGEVFGSIPNGHRREFFCLDEHTWVWHEEWTDQNGKHNVVTTRYDIRPSGILKSQNGNHYQLVDQKEATNLLKAAKLYQQKISQQIYNFA